MPEVFKRVARKYNTKVALRVKRDHEWIQWTYREYYTDVAKAAKSLIRLGLEPHHGVCVLGFNAPEWFIGYMSAIMVSCVCTRRGGGGGGGECLKDHSCTSSIDFAYL